MKEMHHWWDVETSKFPAEPEGIPILLKFLENYELISTQMLLCVIHLQT